jgi:hypothetical protein
MKEGMKCGGGVWQCKKGEKSRQRMQGNDHRSSEKGCERGMCQICLKKCVSAKKMCQMAAVSV